MSKTMHFSGELSGPTVQGKNIGRRASSGLRRGWARGIQGLVACVALAGVAGARAGAQSTKDSAAYSRAQQMVANGDAANGRKLVDSVAAAAPAGSAAFAEGLFWRATLAANARDSEHEYRQIIVDYPLSGRVPDALLRIGQLEAARGENAAALQHFQRLVLEHPQSPLRPEASYWVARMYFEGNDAAHGCAANADALASVRPAAVELKNRIDFQQQRCRGVALAAANNGAAAPPAAPATGTTVAPKATSPRATSPKTRSSSPAPATPVPPKKEVAKATVTPEASEPSASTSATADRAEADAKVTAEPPKPAPKPVPTPAPTSPVTNSTVTPTISNAGATPGAVTRQPTKEEVARALASANLQVSPKASASIARKSQAPQSTKAASGVQTDSSAPAATPAAKSTVTSNAKPSAGSYAVQIAAFGTKSAATVLANKLHGRGYDAYVDGSSSPYRVRLGHFSTHTAAAAELVKLKAKHIDGFVVER